MKLKNTGHQLSVADLDIDNTSIRLQASDVCLVEARLSGGHHPISAHGQVPVYFVLAPILVRWIERRRDAEDQKW